ncbi:MAG: hypothetical protein LQ345_002291 [Seirophora villosa]|nr:MAG: hypothetical protein LQ345_002291 [Seirophora villosa]
MIERATICLENGGKHLLRIPKKSFTTQRSLHSAFWSHGAGDINLPAWWHAFLQAPTTNPPPWLLKANTRDTGNTNLDATEVALLDFLYPIRTLAVIRDYVRKNTTALRRHRRSQLLHQRSRNYTSAADNPIDEGTDQAEAADNTLAGDALAVDRAATEASHLTQAELTTKLHKLLFTDQQPSVHQIWQYYVKLREGSVLLGPDDLAQLFKRLSQSRATFGLEKTRELFDTSEVSERRAIHYACTVAAALGQDDLKSAVKLHAEAATRVGEGSFGTSLVFNYAIERANWEAALAVWRQFGDYRRMYLAESSLWAEFDRSPLPDLLEHARKAVEFAVNSIEGSTFDEAEPARKLAFAIVQRALSVHNADFDSFVQADLVEKAESIQQPGVDLFRAAILQNFSLGVKKSEYSHWGLDLYCTARMKSGFSPDRELLDTLLRRCYDLRRSEEMYYILEDYQKHHTEVPRHAYLPLLSQFAQHGDFDLVDQLCREYIGRFGAQDISVLASQLLHACYRRADVDGAISVIESLQRTYGYIPDMRAWNTVFATYSRIDDCEGATRLLDRLVATNVKPDNKSYGILMGMFAKRSDLAATNELYEQAISEGVNPSFDMVGSLILALATNDRLDEAERLAEDALDMDLEAPARRMPSLTGDHSRTRMWNVLLGQHAMKGQLDKVFKLQNRMREAGIAFDGATYAALMQSLCIKKLPAAAQKILKVVMPKVGIRPTAFHYAIVMGGFLHSNDYLKIFSLQKRMDREGIKPTFSTRNMLLRAESSMDEKEYYQGNSDSPTFEASRAQKVLTEILDNLDPMELASLGPTKFAQSNPPDVALQISYFPYMINLYGKRKLFDKVAEMYDMYISTRQKISGDSNADPPVELLSALMTSYTKAGEHHEAEKCWQLALEKAQHIACKADADTSQAGWVLHKYRFLLALPLTRHMHVLAATSRVNEIEPLIESLQQAGFQLSTHNWNKYVQVLVENDRALPAYQICEGKLMEGWPGWQRFGSYLNKKRRIKRQWVPRSWEMARPFPHYETLVFLASAYLTVQGRAYGAGRELLGEIEKAAPKTMEAVFNLPTYDDRIQQKLLKRE